MSDAKIKTGFYIRRTAITRREENDSLNGFREAINIVESFDMANGATTFTFTIRPVSTSYTFRTPAPEPAPPSNSVPGISPTVTFHPPQISASSSTTATVIESSGDGAPTVVNLKAKELRKGGCRNIQEWLDVGDRHLYIGRQIRISLGGGEWAYLKKSKWHNPYKGDRDEVVKSFEEYARGKFTADDLKELEGKVLGCCTR